MWRGEWIIYDEARLSERREVEVRREGGITETYYRITISSLKERPAEERKKEKKKKRKKKRDFIILKFVYLHILFSSFYLLFSAALSKPIIHTALFILLVDAIFVFLNLNIFILV